MTKKVSILVVDDNKDDVFLLRYAFKKAGLDPSLIHVGDGEEAVNYLAGQKCYTDRSRYPLPILILLDVKMPKLGGFDVLEWLLTRQDLKELPVVMFSSSFQTEDVEKAKALGAADYLTKPTGVEGFDEIIQTIANKWLALMK
jgi:CheY-like chemotaxis protein